MADREESVADADGREVDMDSRDALILESVGLLVVLGLDLDARLLVEKSAELCDDDEPWVFGLQRVENELVSAYAARRWLLPDPVERQGRAFAEVTVLERRSSKVVRRALRMLFADPAKPNRIIFDRFPREPDALAQFVALDHQLRGATSVEDLAGDGPSRRFLA